MLADPMLARFKKHTSPNPVGQDREEKLDTHIIGFGKLGAQFLPR